ncbi:MAG: O-antigen ligase family protein [Candidatus Moraniibacteriota bacterium]
MESPLAFQKIKEKFSADDKAALLIIGCFLILGFARIFLGFIPWYLLIVMLPMFYVSLLYPKAGLYGIIFLTVLFERFFTLEALQFGREAIKLYSLDIVLLGVYGGVLARMLYAKTRLTLKPADVWLLIFFFVASLYCVASFIGFGNQDLAVAFSTWKNYVFYGALFFAVPLLVENESDVRKIVKYFLAAASIGILFLVIGVVRGEGLWTEFTPLSTAGVRLLAFPHAFYFSLAFLGMFVTAEYWARNRYRALLWIVLALWLFGILGSLMRHMWIGMAVAIGVAWVFLLNRATRQTTRKMIVIGLAFGTLILSFWLFVSLLFPTSTAGHAFQNVGQTVVMRVTSMSNAYDESIAWRGSTWQSAFSELSHNPFFGSGFGAHIPVEQGDYRDFVEIRNIHNSWLALLVQMGMIGFVTLAFSLGLLVWRVLRTRPEARFLGALRVALLTLFVYQGIVLFAQPYLETNLTGVFFWLTLGLMHTLCSLAEKSSLEHV